MSPSLWLSPRNGAWARSQGISPFASRPLAKFGIHIHANRSRQARGRNVQADEYCASLRVGQSGAVVEGRIFIRQARLYHLKALQLQRPAHLHRKFQNDFTFPNAAGSARAGVSSSVRRDRVQQYSIPGEAVVEQLKSTAKWHYRLKGLQFVAPVASRAPDSVRGGRARTGRRETASNANTKKNHRKL